MELADFMPEPKELPGYTVDVNSQRNPAILITGVLGCHERWHGLARWSDTGQLAKLRLVIFLKNFETYKIVIS